jgi:peptide/nickel transport system substrate-binding protein
MTPTTVANQKSSRSRRAAAFLLGASLLMAACGSSANPSTSTAPGQSPAGAPTKTTLVIGTDISDAQSLDPGIGSTRTTFLTLKGPYDNLTTTDPSDYSKILPQLATSWEPTPDGTGLTFHLREGVKFTSGNPFTADDVKFTFDRVQNLKAGPSGYTTNVASVDVIDPLTVKINLVDPAIPFLPITTIVGIYGILDSKLVTEQGGVSGPGADSTDKATAYLDQHSAGTGPYQITSWERGAQIVLDRNPNYWGGTPPFERIILKGFSDSAAEALALDQGDIDMAMTLNSDQLSAQEGKAGISISETSSLDYVFWTLSENASDSGALADARVREAVFKGVDYQSIIDGLLGGNAVRPAGFMPIGLGGMTAAFAEQNRYAYDPTAAKQLLTDAGYPDGFTFTLSYGTYTFAGVPYDQLAAKIQSDLSKIGVTVKLNPMDATTFTTAYRAGETVSALADWTGDAPDPWTFAYPSIERQAKRSHWTPSAAIVDQLTAAASETDPAKQVELWVAFEKAIIAQNAYSILFQPSYRWAVRDTVTGVKLTAFWFVNLGELKPTR